jgi:hypothetical protein
MIADELYKLFSEQTEEKKEETKTNLQKVHKN